MSISNHVWGVSPGADKIWGQVAGLRPSVSSQRMFMTLQAYMDDSQDKSADGIFVLAGYIANVEQWAAFSKEWEELKHFSCIQNDGSYYFKTSEMIKMNRPLQPFYSVIERHVMASVACIVDKGVLRKCISNISASVETSDGLVIPFPIDGFLEIWKDPNVLAIRAILDHVYSMWFSPSDEIELSHEPMDLYFDTWNRQDMILNVWNQYVANRPEDVRALYRSYPRFESDKEFLPLQAADFWAWWVRHFMGKYGLDFAKWQTPFIKTEKKVRRIILYLSEQDIMQSFADNIKITVENHVKNGCKFEIRNA